MTKRTADTADLNDDLRPEYDFSRMKPVGRGLYAARYKAGRSIRILEDDASKELPIETGDEISVGCTTTGCLSADESRETFSTSMNRDKLTTVGDTSTGLGIESLLRGAPAPGWKKHDR